MGESLDPQESSGGHGEYEIAALGHSRQFPHHDAGRLIVVALVPPDALLDPPAILALVVEQHSTSRTYVVLELYLKSLLIHGFTR